MISLGTQLIKMITSLTDKFGGLNTVIGLVGGALMQKNGLGLLFNKDKNGVYSANNGLIPKITNFISQLKSARQGIANEVKAINNVWSSKRMASAGYSKDTKLTDMAAGFQYGQDMADRIQNFMSLGYTKGFAEYIAQLDEATFKQKTLGEIT